MQIQDIASQLQAYTPKSDVIDVHLIPNKGVVLLYETDLCNVEFIIPINCSTVCKLQVKVEDLKNSPILAKKVSKKVFQTIVDSAIIENNTLIFTDKNNNHVVKLPAIGLTSSQTDIQYETIIPFNNPDLLMLLAIVAYKNEEVKGIFCEIVLSTLNLMVHTDSSILVHEFNLSSTGFDPESDHLEDFIIPPDLILSLRSSHSQDNEKLPITLCLSSYGYVKVSKGNISLSFTAVSAHKGLKNKSGQTVNLGVLKSTVTAEMGQVKAPITPKIVGDLLKNLESPNSSITLKLDTTGLWLDEQIISKNKSVQRSKKEQGEVTIPPTLFKQVLRTCPNTEGADLYFPAPQTTQAFVLKTKDFLLCLTTIINHEDFSEDDTSLKQKTTTIKGKKAKEVSPIPDPVEEAATLQEKREAIEALAEETENRVIDAHCSAATVDPSPLEGEVMLAIEKGQEAKDYNLQELEEVYFRLKFFGGRYIEILLDRQQQWQLTFNFFEPNSDVPPFDVEEKNKEKAKTSS